MREAHLRDFIAVIETGSVRSAARKLGLTQAAVSKNLTALERALGVSLLVRTTQGVEPTEFGRVTLRRARIVDAELRKLQEELDNLSGDQHGHVAVGLSAMAESALLPTAVTRFRAGTPGVLVSVMGGRASSTIAALREAKIDFAVGALDPAQIGSDLHLERLCSSELGIVSRADHPMAKCADLAELAPYGWIFTVRHADGEPTITTMLRKRGLFEPVLAAHSDSTSALVSLLMQTDFVSLATLSAMQPYLQHGLLSALPIALELPPVVQYLITSAARPLTASAAAFAAEFRRASRRLRR